MTTTNDLTFLLAYLGSMLPSATKISQQPHQKVWFDQLRLQHGIGGPYMLITKDARDKCKHDTYANGEAAKHQDVIKMFMLASLGYMLLAATKVTGNPIS